MSHCYSLAQLMMNLDLGDQQKVTELACCFNEAITQAVADKINVELQGFSDLAQKLKVEIEHLTEIRQQMHDMMRELDAKIAKVQADIDSLKEMDAWDSGAIMYR